MPNRCTVHVYIYYNRSPRPYYALSLFARAAAGPWHLIAHSSRPSPDDVRVEIQIVPSNVCFFAIPPPPDVGVEIRIVHPIDVKRLLFLRSRSALGEVIVAVVAGTTFEPTGLTPL